MRFRPATRSDHDVLARMNQQLIRDEGHRNKMTLPELVHRMQEWLENEYQAILFEQNDVAAGYALFRHEPDHVYLRQFYVDAAHRRKGIGRAALQWLSANPWKNVRRCRIDVLAGNRTGIDFWKATGFSEYCVTMEMENPAFEGRSLH